MTTNLGPGLGAPLQAKLDELKVPGAVVLVRSASHGEWSSAFGTRAIGGDERVTMDDHIRIGSNTKTMTGVVILQLVQEGSIALDDPVAEHWPDVPNGRRITIASMLEMRSGLYSYTLDEAFEARLDTEPGHAWHPTELLSIAFAHPPSFSPDAGYEYSNTNTVLLGLIVEQLTNQPLEEAFRQRIFKPLGLKETTMPAAGDTGIPTPHPRGYMFGTNESTLTEPGVPAWQRAALADGTLRPNDFTDSSPSWAWAAGAAISTAADLARYVEAVVDGELLHADQQEKWLASFRPTGPEPTSPTYGYHLGQFGPLIGHTGQIPGFNSFMGRDPERRNTVVLWTSLVSGPDGQMPVAELAKIIMGSLYA